MNTVRRQRAGSAASSKRASALYLERQQPKSDLDQRPTQTIETVPSNGYEGNQQSRTCVCL